MARAVVVANLFTAATCAARVAGSQADVHASDFIPSAPIVKPAWSVPWPSLHAAPPRTQLPLMAMRNEAPIVKPAWNFPGPSRHATPPRTNTVRNLRPVLQNSFLLYRSATLDNLSEADAEALIDGTALGGSRPLAAVIDLRNSDEIRKGEAERTEGSTTFYSSLQGYGEGSYGRDDGGPRYLHIPILRDVDRFWECAIGRMDGPSRISATLKTVFEGGALDRAAARNLERGGLPALYTVMLETAGSEIVSALEACLRESARGDVLFHCQKGKDRTGVLSMLIQSCAGEGEEQIVRSYGMSGDLLGGEDSQKAAEGQENKSDGGSRGGTVDWSRFRGSPESAMAETLDWMNSRYGSVEGYLDTIGFDAGRRSLLRDRLTLLRD